MTVFYGNFIGTSKEEAMVNIGELMQNQSAVAIFSEFYPEWSGESSGFEFIFTNDNGNCKLF